MRRIFYLSIVLMIISYAHPAVAEDSSLTHIQDDLLEELGGSEIDHYWQRIITDYGEYLPDLEKVSFHTLVKEQGEFSLKSIFSSLIKFLLHEFILNSQLLGILLLLTIFSATLQTLQKAFSESSISQIAYFVIYIGLIYIALNSFMIAYAYTKETIDTLSGFMIALVPLILSLMATVGSITALAYFHPMTIFLIHTSSVIVSKVVLPLLLLGALLQIVSSLSKHYRMTHLAQMFRTFSLGILGALLTIFIGVMSVQGGVHAAQDGLILKTAKFLTGNLIPVIGQTFTDAADTVLGASLLLKNAVGIVGLIIIVLIVIFPALKLFVIAFIYKLAAATLQPLSDGPVVVSLHTVSQYMFFILACLLTVSLMFFLAIIVLIVSSNVILLFR